jgi:hypothetical protein
MMFDDARQVKTGRKIWLLTLTRVSIDISIMQSMARVKIQVSPLQFLAQIKSIEGYMMETATDNNHKF